VVPKPAPRRRHGALAAATVALFTASVVLGILLGGQLKARLGLRHRRTIGAGPQPDLPVTVQRLNRPTESMAAAELDDATAPPPLSSTGGPSAEGGDYPPRLLLKVAITDRAWHEPDRPDRRLRGRLGWPSRWHRAGHVASLDVGWAAGTQGIHQPSSDRRAGARMGE
jgi:hypothetical protein